MITQTQTFSFEVAHYFPNMPKGSKHNALHGHSYYCDLCVSGELDEYCFVSDFESLNRACKDIKETLDHKLINDVVGENPSMENIAKHIGRVFKKGQRSDGISFSFLKNVKLIKVSVYRPRVGQKVEVEF